MTDFVYVGHNLSWKNEQEVTLKYGIILGYAAFRKHKAMLKSARISIHIENDHPSICKQFDLHLWCHL